MKTVIDKKDAEFIDEVEAFLKELTAEERQRLGFFIQGMKFEKKRHEKGPAA